MFCRYTLFGGRRRGDRRQGGDEGTFVDQHGARLLVAALVIVGLNVLDAFFTLLFLAHGGQELNPMVAAVLGLGAVPFLLAKTVGVGLCTGFLVLTKNFRASRIGMGLVGIGYGALLAWHLYLLAMLEAGSGSGALA